MNAYIDLTKEEVFDVLEEDGELIGRGSWKWGHTETYIFDCDGSKYKLTVQYHRDEGIMFYDNITRAVRVKPVEKTIIEWVEG